MEPDKQNCPLIQEIEKDFIAAVRSKNQLKVSTLRLLKTAFKNAIIEKRAPLTQEEAQQIVRSEIKKHRDSIDAFKKGGREDLVLAEKKELAILERYLPPQLSEEEIKKTIQKQISQLGEVSPKDFGKVMGAVMNELKGRADGGVVSRLVKEVLGGERNECFYQSRDAKQ